MHRSPLAVVFLLASLGCLQSVSQTPSRVSKSMGSEGGTLALGTGLSLELPAGALKDGTEVAIEVVPDDAAKLGERLTPTFKLMPEAAQFAKPVRLTFDLSPHSAADAAVMTATATGKPYEKLEAKAVGASLLEVEVAHFSVFVAVAVPPAQDCGGAEPCPTGCLGDTQNCGECGTACSGGACFAGKCIVAGWQKVLTPGAKMASVWAAGSGNVIAGGPGTFVLKPNGVLEDTREGRYTTAVWSDDRGVVLACDWGGPGLVRSDDGGTTWASVNASPPGCWSFWGIGDEVWCAGQPPYHSTDRGLTWTEVPTGPTLESAMSMWGSDAQHLYAVVNPPNALRPFFILFTQDGGKTWARTESPERLFSVHGTGADNVWAVGEKGTVFRCGAGACVRASFPATTEDLRSVYAKGDSVYVGGQRLYTSHDRGQSWAAESPSPGPAYFYFLSVALPGALLVIDTESLCARAP